jgi:hypothetical protein
VPPTLIFRQYVFLNEPPMLGLDDALVVVVVVVVVVLMLPLVVP